MLKPWGADTNEFTSFALSNMLSRHWSILPVLDLICSELYWCANRKQRPVQRCVEWFCCNFARFIICNNQLYMLTSCHGHAYKVSAMQCNDSSFIIYWLCRVDYVQYCSVNLFVDTTILQSFGYPIAYFPSMPGESNYAIKTYTLGILYTAWFYPSQTNSLLYQRRNAQFYTIVP